MRIQLSNTFSKRHYNMIKIMMWTGLSLGLYSKLHKSFAFTIAAKIYCLAFAIVLLYFYGFQLILVHDMVAFTSLLYYAIIYASSVIVLLLTHGENVFNYMDEFDKMDPMGLVEIKNFKVLFTILVFVAIIILHLCRLVRFSTMEMFEMKIVVTNSLLTLAMHLSQMTGILMFEVLWIHMKSLRKTMDNSSNINNEEQEEEYSAGQVQLQIRKLEDFLFIYKKILDNVKKIGHGTKFLMLVSLPFCMIYLLAFVDMLSRNQKFLIVGASIMEIVLNIILPCIPALFGELANSEVEKIKDNLTRHYRTCYNNSLQKRILDGIKFIELRPFKFTVWRLFTVDLSLPLTVFTICTTYTIILLQFKQIQS